MMNRCFGWSMLVAVGIVLGCVLSSYEGIPAAVAAEDDESSQIDDQKVLDQLKDIRAELKAIHKHLRTGTLKVAVIMTPDAPPNVDQQQ